MRAAKQAHILMELGLLAMEKVWKSLAEEGR